MPGAGEGGWREHSPVSAHHGKRRANEKKPTSTTHGAVDKAHRWEDRGREAKHKEPREATAWT